MPVGQQTQMPQPRTEADIRSQMQNNYNQAMKDPNFMRLPAAQQEAYKQDFQKALSQTGQFAQQEAMRASGQMPPQMQPPLPMQQGLGQAAMGGGMPSQQLLNGVQQGLGGGLQAQPMSPQMQQQMLAASAALRAGQSLPAQQMPPQQMAQQAPMGMGMGQFGQQVPQREPQNMPFRPTLQMAMSRLRGGK